MESKRVAWAVPEKGGDGIFRGIAPGLSAEVAGRKKTFRGRFHRPERAGELPERENKTGADGSFRRILS